MNSLHNNRSPQHLLAKLFVLFLFFMIASSVLGSGPGEFIKFGEHEGRTSAQITAENRRSADERTTPSRRASTDSLGVLEDDSLEFDSLPTTPVKTKPSRLSIDMRRLSVADMHSISGSVITVMEESPSSTIGTLLKEKELETQKQRSRLIQQFLATKDLFEGQQARLQKKNLADRQQIIRAYDAILMAKNLPPSLVQPAHKMRALNEAYAKQQSASTLSYRLALYPLENEFLRSYLLKREVLLPDVNESTNPLEQLNSKASSALQKTHTTGIALIKELIPSFSDDRDQSSNSFSDELIPELNNLTVPQIEYLNGVIEFIRTTQLFILGCHTAPYITASKRKLDEIEAYLETNSLEKSQTIPRDSTAVKTAYHNSNDLCSSSKATFSLMETISAKASFSAAGQSALAIQEQLNAIKNLAASFSHEQEEANSSNKDLLKMEARAMKELQSKVQDAELAYREIEDESWIDKKCGHLHELKSQIQEMQAGLREKAQDLGLMRAADPSPLDDITSLLEDPAFALDEIKTLPQHPSLFLGNLKTLDPSFDQQKITGTQGKVVLDIPDKVKGKYSEEIRREWVSGINLIRLALCRDFGFRVMQEFDTEHQIKMRELNPLTVSELKKFLFTDEGHPKFTRSFFIPREMTHEDFLRYLESLSEDLGHTAHLINTVEADKVIKVDAATLAFNPFDKKGLPPTQENIAAAEWRQRQAGFNQVREALKKAFPEASLTEKQLQEVLEKFDTQFKLHHSIREKPPLTLAAVAQFIGYQKTILKNRSYWEQNISPYLDRDALITNALSGFSYTIGSHFGTALLFALPYLYLAWLNHTNHMTSSST